MAELVVAFDTCGPVIGVAAASETATATRSERIRRGAEGRLIPWAQEVCAELGGGLDDVVGVVAARGPGAFTGLRVGLSAAIGLAIALDVPIWGGDSLTTRRSTAPDGRVLIMLDARKQRVYACAFDGDQMVVPPADVAPEIAVAWMKAPFTATGEGAVVYRQVVEAQGGTVVEEADAPATEALARAGWSAIRAGDGRRPESLEPLYLRPADAKPSRRGRLTRETKRRS